MQTNKIVHIHIYKIQNLTDVEPSVCTYNKKDTWFPNTCILGVATLASLWGDTLMYGTSTQWRDEHGSLFRMHKLNPEKKSIWNNIN
jgi:hypothetical protein